ncbi:ankyrin [Haematococcus lacustris]|uniref:Ankyrin n=1 Tax=Haematococcus lacustris TaxID=44745 RepID=A0A6A0AG46_HAELA|nr:ankyrin [Haematococcus lacustris]
MREVTDALGVRGGHGEGPRNAAVGWIGSPVLSGVGGFGQLVEGYGPTTARARSVSIPSWMAGEGLRSSVEKLTEFNWDDWELLMKSHLIYNDLWEVVEEGLEEAESGSIEFKAPTAAKARKDVKAKAVIVLHLSSQFLQLAKDSQTAAELWERLTSVFNVSAAASRIGAVQELAQISPAESD